MYTCVLRYTPSHVHTFLDKQTYTCITFFIKKVSEPPIPAVGIKNCDINKLNNISK